MPGLSRCTPHWRRFPGSRSVVLRGGSSMAWLWLCVKFWFTKVIHIYQLVHHYSFQDRLLVLKSRFPPLSHPQWCPSEHDATRDLSYITRLTLNSFSDNGMIIIRTYRGVVVNCYSNIELMLEALSLMWPCLMYTVIKFHIAKKTKYCISLKLKDTWCWNYFHLQIWRKYIVNRTLEFSCKISHLRKYLFCPVTWSDTQDIWQAKLTILSAHIALQICR